MPFLPFVVLLAWQALSKSASFALGWATALYFGQVPGRQGRVLSVVSLAAAAWVVLVVGFALPLLASDLLVRAGVLSDGFDVRPLHALGLGAAVLLIPPAIAVAVVFGQLVDEETVGGWVRRVALSYPATAMLGLSVLQMVAITPALLVVRWRSKRTLLQVPLVMAADTSDDDLVDAVGRATRAAGLGAPSVARATGPKTWPMRTVGFAARHLLESVVRGEPMELHVDGLEIYVYATNVSILGPVEDAHRVRAAVSRELGLVGAHLTWSDDAQELEGALHDAARETSDDVNCLRRRLDEIQATIDAASLNSEEWNVLYRLRLQIEQRAVERRR